MFWPAAVASLGMLDLLNFTANHTEKEAEKAEESAKNAEKSFTDLISFEVFLPNGESIFIRCDEGEEQKGEQGAENQNSSTSIHNVSSNCRARVPTVFDAKVAVATYFNEKERKKENPTSTRIDTKDVASVTSSNKVLSEIDVRKNIPPSLIMIWCEEGENDYPDEKLLSDDCFDDGIYAGLPAVGCLNASVNLINAMWKSSMTKTDLERVRVMLVGKCAEVERINNAGEHDKMYSDTNIFHNNKQFVDLFFPKDYFDSIRVFGTNGSKSISPDGSEERNSSVAVALVEKDGRYFM